MLYLVFSKKQKILNLAAVEAGDQKEAIAKAKALLPISKDDGADFGFMPISELKDGWTLYAEA